MNIYKFTLIDDLLGWDSTETYISNFTEEEKWVELPREKNKKELLSNDEVTWKETQLVLKPFQVVILSLK